MTKINTDVVIVWENKGALRVLTTFYLEGQIGKKMLFPSQARGELARESPAERVIEPLRNRFILPASNILLLEQFVRYNAWVYPTNTEDFYFHLVDIRGLPDVLWRKEKLKEAGDWREFDRPDFVSVDKLMAMNPKVNPSFHGLILTHFYGLKNVLHKFPAQSLLAELKIS